MKERVASSIVSVALQIIWTVAIYLEFVFRDIRRHNRLKNKSALSGGVRSRSVQSVMDGGTQRRGYGWSNLHELNIHYPSVLLLAKYPQVPLYNLKRAYLARTNKTTKPRHCANYVASLRYVKHRRNRQREVTRTFARILQDGLHWLYNSRSVLVHGFKCNLCLISPIIRTKCHALNKWSVIS